MNQEKIGKMIKEIRTKEKLSQQKFAEKYGVTYQAVSKWENGKNIPDISILKQICSEYHMNLEDFLDAKPPKSIDSTIRFLLPIIIIVLLLIIIVFLLFIKNNYHDFEFKTLSTSCDNFKLYGNIAYNEKNSSIHISNITYCGGDDTIKYQTIECSLFEINQNIKTEISKCNYKQNKNITLDKFLEGVNFNVHDYKNTCKVYKENTLELEIAATDIQGKITTYKIPLTLKENCID